jgi:peptidoglycan/xylan/chitin deacetylase (PgdA/CDA1 family)
MNTHQSDRESLKLHTAAIFCNNKKNLQTIENYFMNFWKIPYHTNPLSGGIYLAKFMYKVKLPQISLDETPTLVMPSDEGDFENWLKDKKIKVKNERHVKLKFLATANANFTLTLQRLYKYQGPKLTPILTLNDYSIIDQIMNQKTYLLTIDIIKEFEEALERGLNPTLSVLFKIYSKIPISYNFIPPFIRNHILRRNVPDLSIDHVTYEDKLPLDALRYLFLKCLTKIAEHSISTQPFWPKGKKYALCITHDIETYNGLKNAPRLKEVEQKYRIKSTWNIITERYPLNHKILKHLAENGEIGAHDTKHDGKLVTLTIHETTERMKQCRSTLTQKIGTKIHGFRTPLLQHSGKITESAAQAEYEYISTIPTWEPLHPTAMKQHGIGTAFPLILDNRVVEIPVTFPQDHQLLEVLRKSPEQCIQIWLLLKKYFKNIGGVCTLLIHPDYRFAEPESIKHYEHLLKTFVEDPECWITTLNQLAQWWKTRAQQYSTKE